jgi:hypothetical protein
VIGLKDVRNLLQRGQWSRRDGEIRWRSRPIDEWARRRVAEARRLTALLVALEARYLPTLEEQWIHLTNASVEEWEAFITHYDSQSLLGRLGWSPDELLRAAEGLLFSARRLDPLGRGWSELVRRAPRRAWDDLSGDALAAVDHRVAAEVLVRCYEDLAGGGVVPPLAERVDLFHSEGERISHRSQPLDANLSTLGISPHPGVVLVVEGETEELLVPRVRDHMRIPHRTEVVQSIVLRGVTRDLTKLAAYATAPLIERKEGQDWLIVKPPTRLMVVVDPDPPFDTPENVENERTKIVDEIIAVLRAQGVDPVRDDLDSLVEVATWTESCFEFAHFEDSELATALASIHPNCGGLSLEQLVAALGVHRAKRQDIKRVWNSWRPQPSKRDLAEALWPKLKLRLEAAEEGSLAIPPPVAHRLIHAFQAAIHRPPGRFVIRGTEIQR